MPIHTKQMNKDGKELILCVSTLYRHAASAMIKMQATERLALSVLSVSAKSITRFNIRWTSFAQLRYDSVGSKGGQ